MATKTIEIDLHCRVSDGGCGGTFTYKPPLVRGSRELQDAAIEKHLRRVGWTGVSVQSLICPKCSRARQQGIEASRHQDSEAA